MALVNFKTLSKKRSSCIDLKAAKAHCYIDEDDTESDGFISLCISQAQAIIDENLLVPFSFFTTKICAIFEDTKSALLPKNPFKEIVDVYFDDGSGWTELKSDFYEIEEGDKYTRLITKTPYKRLKITFIAGEEDAENISLNLKMAVAMLSAVIFDYRGAFEEKSLAENAVYKAIMNNLQRI